MHEGFPCRITFEPLFSDISRVALISACDGI